jgi:hypothetical protein
MGSKDKRGREVRKPKKSAKQKAAPAPTTLPSHRPESSPPPTPSRPDQASE